MAKKLWQTFQGIEALDVGGISFKLKLRTLTETLLFIEAKRWGPLNLYFGGVNFSAPEVLQHYEAAIHGSSFSQFHCVRLRHPFHKSFTGKRAAPNKCSGPWRSDASSRFRVHEKSFPPVAGLPQKVHQKSTTDLWVRCDQNANQEVP